MSKIRAVGDSRLPDHFRKYLCQEVVFLIFKKAYFKPLFSQLALFLALCEWVTIDNKVFLVYNILSFLNREKPQDSRDFSKIKRAVPLNQPEDAPYLLHMRGATLTSP